MSDLVKYDQSDAVAVITLNRPDAMNSFTTQLSLELQLALERAADDDSVRVVVLTGEGRCFSAGADLKAGFEGRQVFGKFALILRIELGSKALGVFHDTIQNAAIGTEQISDPRLIGIRPK